MIYSAVFFDFDYTLADSSEGIVKCFRFVLNHCGFDMVTDEAIRRTIGMTLEDAFRTLTDCRDEQTITIMRNEYTDYARVHMTDCTRFFPDAATLLVDLKTQGVKTAIISTKNRELIDEFLAANDLKYMIDLVLGIYDVAAAKPAPDGIIQAAEQLHVALKDILYVGDSLIDAQAAANAGVDFSAVTTGTTLADSFAALPCKAVVPCLSALRPIIFGE